MTASPPLLCYVCTTAHAKQIVPERSEEVMFHPICVVCLDALIDFFPIRPHKLFARELTGHLPRWWRAAR